MIVLTLQIFYMNIEKKTYLNKFRSKAVVKCISLYPGVSILFDTIGSTCIDPLQAK